MITQKLASFIAAHNVPISLVESSDFKSLLETLDLRYTVPGQSVLNKEIDKLTFDMEEDIKKYLCEANDFAITAHFFSWLDKKYHQVTLL